MTDTKTPGGLEVTEVTIELHQPGMLRDKGEKFLAHARIVLNGEFAVTGMRVIQGSRKRLVAMPSRKAHKPDGVVFVDVSFPISDRAREVIESAVLAAYDAEIAEVNSKRKSGRPLNCHGHDIDCDNNCCINYCDCDVCRDGLKKLNEMERDQAEEVAE